MKFAFSWSLIEQKWNVTAATKTLLFVSLWSGKNANRTDLAKNSIIQELSPILSNRIVMLLK